MMRLIPIKDVRLASAWFVGYLLHPVLELIFSMVMGKNYFKKLNHYMDDFPLEKEHLKHFGLKLRRSISNESLPFKKILEFSSLNKNNQYQNIITLEFLPHEWDFLFIESELESAQ